MSLKRNDIDRALQDKLRDCGLKQFQVAWSQSPAVLRILVENEVRELPISTRLTRRALNETLRKIEMFGDIHARAGARRLEREE